MLHTQDMLRMYAIAVCMVYPIFDTIPLLEFQSLEGAGNSYKNKKLVT